MQIHTIPVGADNCYIIRQRGAILIDGGMPGPTACEDLAKGLEAAGVEAHDLKAIILTHCHWDHIGCVAKIKELTGAPVILHRNEQVVLEQGLRSMPPGITIWGLILGSMLNRYSKGLRLEPCKADITLGDEDFPLEDYGIDGVITATPGHSPGSLSILLDDGSAFVGDLAMNGFPLTFGPSLPIFATDKPKIAESWKKLIKRKVRTIYPAHGKPFAIEELQRRAKL
ncbi:MBL fold metallo-hydrolase [uncultured Cohaesibacter sp.]|uniref:MBL fold metallo-hydrolase n=1 Tax=uncultured Cohaesibacter sp. TaxID=1002546 RepID=UPI00292D08AA|nr:MBL fold metallo-hydrolase [uncultured Cohaesibacter sp.]